MPAEITYYAIVGGGRTADNPYGLVRRLEGHEGPSDESLRRDLTWGFTTAIVDWEHGSYDDELVEISHEQASKIIEYFRERWAAEP
jgi:hypothetical protein